MPKRKLPDNIPKRMLSEAEAAEYVGLSAPSFRIAVGCGVYPQPVSLGPIKRRLWDRHAIDAALDLMSGLGDAQSRAPSSNPDEILRRRIEERRNAQLTKKAVGMSRSKGKL